MIWTTKKTSKFEPDKKILTFSAILVNARQVILVL